MEERPSFEHPELQINKSIARSQSDPKMVTQVIAIQNL
jgi:hypothetical protein